jgi:hypothetical protein
MGGNGNLAGSEVVIARIAKPCASFSGLNNGFDCPRLTAEELDAGLVDPGRYVVALGRFKS